MIHLKVVEKWREAAPVRDHDVPVFLRPPDPHAQWDLTTTQVTFNYLLLRCSLTSNLNCLFSKDCCVLSILLCTTIRYKINSRNYLLLFIAFEITSYSNGQVANRNLQYWAMNFFCTKIICILVRQHGNLHGNTCRQQVTNKSLPIRFYYVTMYQTSPYPFSPTDGCSSTRKFSCIRAYFPLAFHSSASLSAIPTLRTAPTKPSLEQSYI